MKQESARKGWLSATATITCRYIKGKVPDSWLSESKKQIPAYANPKYPGVLIHRRYDREGNYICWTFTHEPSGYSMVDRHYTKYRTLSDAVRAFMCHAAHINWDRPKAEIEQDPAARAAALKLSEEPYRDDRKRCRSPKS